jgi:hypothetical protein
MTLLACGSASRCPAATQQRYGQSAHTLYFFFLGLLCPEIAVERRKKNEERRNLKHISAVRKFASNFFRAFSNTSVNN